MSGRLSGTQLFDGVLEAALERGLREDLPIIDG
jgi:hypothetical protein